MLGKGRGQVAEPALTPKQCTGTLGVSREMWVQVCESPSNLGPSLLKQMHHTGGLLELVLTWSDMHLGESPSLPSLPKGTLSSLD